MAFSVQVFLVCYWSKSKWKLWHCKLHNANENVYTIRLNESVERSHFDTISNRIAFDKHTHTHTNGIHYTQSECRHPRLAQVSKVFSLTLLNAVDTRTTDRDFVLWLKGKSENLFSWQKATIVELKTEHSSVEMLKMNEMDGENFPQINKREIVSSVFISIQTIHSMVCCHKLERIQWNYTIFKFGR